MDNQASFLRARRYQAKSCSRCKNFAAVHQQMDAYHFHSLSFFQSFFFIASVKKYFGADEEEKGFSLRKHTKNRQNVGAIQIVYYKHLFLAVSSARFTNGLGLRMKNLTLN